MPKGPLALCVKHEEPIVYRAKTSCPLCAAEARIAELERTLREMTREKATHAD